MRSTAFQARLSGHGADSKRDLIVSTSSKAVNFVNSGYHWPMRLYHKLRRTRMIAAKEYNTSGEAFKKSRTVVYGLVVTR